MSLAKLDARALVSRWQADPIAIWERQARAAQFIKPAPPGHYDGNHDFGGAVETRVAARLEALGYAVATTSHKAAYDLLLDDRLRVEVKAARWRVSGGRGRYQACFRNKTADWVIFVARNGQDHHFIIPIRALGKRRTLTIRCEDIAAYAGKYAAYREAWHLLGGQL